MEIVERFAYYGLRSLLPIYMVVAYEDGGPQFTHIEKGIIFGWWAIVQSFIPVLSGGFADRFGFKKNIAIATAIKIVGYLLMGYAIEIAAVLNGGNMELQKGAAGGDYTFWVFFVDLNQSVKSLLQNSLFFLHISARGVFLHLFL